jgi:hypothetical protein
MHLLKRVRGIILRPDAEWGTIAAEPADARALLLNYAAILALIPAVCGFIGASLIGVRAGGETFRTPLLAGALNAALGYVLTFAVVYLAALVADMLAPVFKGERNLASALKLSVYGHTPAWLAGIFLLVPGLRFLVILGLYALYLVWTGAPALMRVPHDRAFLYAVAFIVCALLLTVLSLVLQDAAASYFPLT